MKKYRKREKKKNSKNSFCRRHKKLQYSKKKIIEAITNNNNNKINPRVNMINSEECFSGSFITNFTNTFKINGKMLTDASSEP